MFKKIKSLVTPVLHLPENQGENHNAKAPYCGFFKFMSKKTVDPLEQYLDSVDSNLKILNCFPEIKKIFILYNVVLPSSASVERVFSIGGQILTQNRMRMGDELFEQLLFLRCNKKI